MKLLVNSHLSPLTSHLSPLTSHLSPLALMKLSLLAFLSILLLMGCDKSIAQNLIPIEVNRDPFWTIDDEYAAIADNVPSFGGLYLKKGNLIIVSTDLSKKSDIIAALTWVQKNGFALDPSTNLNKANFIEGDYNWRELKNTFDIVSAKIPFQTWTSIDIDEKLNRVEIELASMTEELQYRNWLKSLNLPLEMVVFKEGREMIYYNDLHSKIRPTISGLRINAGQGNCTLGLNAELVTSGSYTVTSGTKKGFITASHCLPEMGRVTQTKVYQPERGSFGVNNTGVERIDPPFLYPLGPPIVQNCPVTGDFLCRYSDATFIEYNDNMNYEKGKIARVSASPALLPDTSSSATGTFPILPNPITFSGTLNNNQLMVGQIAQKVGQKTGWTSGEIVDVCTTLRGKRTVYNGAYQATNVAHLCTSVVDAGSSAGDSGASVWINSGGANKIAGILFAGGTTSLGYREYYFSSIQYVFLELSSGVWTVN